MRARVAASFVLVLVATTGCSTFGLGDDDPTEAAPPDPLPAGLEVVAACEREPPPRVTEVLGLTADVIAHALLPCATSSVALATPEPSTLELVAAAGLAARLGVPLYDDVDTAVAAMRPVVVVVEEEVSATASPSADENTTVLSGLGTVAMATAIARHTSDSRVVLLGDDTALDAGLRIVARHGGILLPTPEAEADVLALVQVGFEVAYAEVASATAAASPAPLVLSDPGFPTRERDVWLVGEEPALRAPMLDVASALGREQVVQVVAGDPRDDIELQALLDQGGAAITTIRRDAASTLWQDWQLATVLAGNELPGGGFTLFPGRRFVALYGHPEFGGLGVLGEQGPQAAVERAQSLAADHETDDGLTTVPAFDLITTLAAGEATPDGDYSRPLDPEVIRPWIDAASEAGVYVTLDFQPGRSSYMDQIPLYEEFLLLPNVGVALDPEWRLLPDQVHLRQVGSLDASEVNEVADYLAGLVREHALPQKLLVVHQFQLRMIRNREILEHPPELAVLIHMDGQGSIAAKDETYRAITTGFEDRVWWGWKNFYDEDVPTPSVAHTLSREPAPVFISYQ